MRIVAYTDSSVLHGAEAVLATVLAGLEPGHDVTVIGPAPGLIRSLAARRPGTASLQVRPPRDKRDLRSCLRLLRAVRALRPDVLVVNDTTLLSSRYAALAGICVRGVQVVAIEHGTPTAGGHRRQLLAKGLIARRLAAIVAVSEQSGEVIARMLRLSPGRLRIIPNGVRDPWPGLPAREPVPGVLRVFTACRLEPGKAVDVLLRAVAQVPGVHLVIAGSGSRSAALQELASCLGIAERVELLGWVERLDEHLGRADAFALTSRREALPLVVLEAMFAGLPVVATDVGAMREAVRPGCTGLLVPPDDPAAVADALARLLADPDLRARYGAAGRARAVERFGVDRMVRAYRALLDEVTARSR